MSSVCLIDTSIFLNLLDVPYCNESRAEVAQDFVTFTEAGCSFLTIIQEFEKACARFPMSEVFIWSLDSDLQIYRQTP